MESTLAKVLGHMAALGPGFLVAVVFAIFLFMERKKSEKMAEKLLELAQESIKSDTEHTKAIQALENNRLEELSSDAIQPGPGKMGGRGMRGGGRGRGIRLGAGYDAADRSVGTVRSGWESGSVLAAAGAVLHVDALDSLHILGALGDSKREEGGHFGGVGIVLNPVLQFHYHVALVNLPMGHPVASACDPVVGHIGIEREPKSPISRDEVATAVVVHQHDVQRSQATHDFSWNIRCDGLPHQILRLESAFYRKARNSILSLCAHQPALDLELEHWFFDRT